MTILLTEKQRLAAKCLGGPARNLLLYGGSRSGKTFLVCWRLAHNALSCPGSRQAILRRHLNTVRTAIGDDTLPKVLELERIRYKYHRVDSVFRFPNGSEIRLLGLDDKERTEKVLGKEFSSMYFNECSEMNWEAVRLGMTRCSMKIDRDILNRPRSNRMYFDCNPPSKRHWTYKAFILKQDPLRNRPWRDPDRWEAFQMNPADNRANLGGDYIDSVLGEYSGRQRSRFLLGEFSDDTENALWKRSMIDLHRIAAAPGDLNRIVVAVDPAVTSGPGSDSTGIIVAGKKIEGDVIRYYVLDDRTVRGSPETWSATVRDAYRSWHADRVVVETNNGGDLVASVLRNTNRDMPITKVHARRGKILRAEPVAGIYEQGRVHHVGEFPDLEDQMCTYTGESGLSSPDNLDALVYAISDLVQTQASARPGTFRFS